jgi:Na+:H+ antiporter, NhaA family
LTLAVVDDVGGILIIAVAYATDVRGAWLMVAAASVLGVVLLRRAEIRSMAAYAALGVLCWYSLHEAGVEAAIAGVVFGLLTPIHPFHDPDHFGDVARTLVDRIEGDDEMAVEDLATYAREVSSPLERIENRLNLWVSFVIVPIFALANAGVRVETDAIDGRVLAGVVFGLVIGKTIGVFSFSYLAVKLGIGRLPAGTTWRHMVGLAVTAGIGFTVALFVTGLSFDDAGLTASAKLGVLIASGTAGTLGYLLLRTSPPAVARDLPGSTLDSDDSSAPLVGSTQST